MGWRLLAAFAIFLGASGGGALAQSGGDANFDSVVSQAEAARDRGEPALAVDLYQQAEALNPKWPDGWWYIGTLDYGSDRYDEAREALTHFIDLTPQAGPALALRGLCEFELAQYAESLEDLRRGIAQGAANQPRNAHIVLYHEALALTRVGRFDEALAKYRALAKDANGAEGNPELALAVALAGMRMALVPKEVDRGQAGYLGAVGQAAMAVMTGDMARGRAGFHALLEANPKASGLHYLYGYLMLTTDPDAAAVQFEQETLVAPDGAGGALAQAMLAWSLGVLGDYASALVHARKAAAEDPTLPMGQLVYGRALVETGDPAAGMSLLEAMLRADPQNLEAHLTLAKAYSKLGRSEEARRERMLCLSLADQQAVPSARP